MSNGKNTTDPKTIKVWVQVGLTLVFGGLAVYLVATEPQDSSKLKWAYGVIGIIIGYWLK